MVLQPKYIDMDLRDRDLADEKLKLIQSIKNAQEIRVKFTEFRGWLYVGHLAYRERSSINRQPVLTTYDPSRNKHILQILDHFYERYLGGGSGETAHHDLYKGMRFTDWIDSNNHDGFFESEEAAKQVLHTYFRYVEKLVYTDEKIGSGNGYHRQKIAYEIFCAVYQTASVAFKYFDPIVQGRSPATEAADQDEVRYNFEVSQALFEQIANWFESYGEFPFKLAMPKEEIWVVPSRIWSMPSWIAKNRDERAYSNWMWDYEKGCINSEELIMQLYGYSPCDARKQIKRSEALMVRANSESNHFLRSIMYNLCCRAFGYIFAAFTVMNTGQIATQAWDEEWEIEAVPVLGGIKLVNIKSRANKFVAFKISKAGLPLFKSYLRFRAKVLSGYPDFNKLLFQLDKCGVPQACPPGFLQTYYNQIRDRIDPDIHQVSVRQLRALKGTLVSDKYSPADAASLLQNAVSTVDKHYTSGLESEQSKEFAEYFKHFNSIVFFGDGGSAEEDSVFAVGSGGCSDFGHPNPIENLATAATACSKPEGCLGCKNFRIHADETDIRKLLSTKYVLIAIGDYLSSAQEYEMIFKPIISSITSLVDVVKQHSEDMAVMVDEVSKSVDDGYLTEYWDEKLQFLIDLGVLS